MDRRTFLSAGLVSAAATRKKYRAAVIGHTGHGDYGHGLDLAWQPFDFIEVVAVADPDEDGLARALARTGAKRGYRNYREMLRKEKPDLVSVGPRWLDQRVEMVTAAAEAGCHVYLEKPFARDLVDADRMVEAVERHGVRLQVAHQMCRNPNTLLCREMLRQGEIGALQEVRARGKEDRRAGGEDIAVDGCHQMVVLRMLLGDPKWVFAHVTHDGREIGREHIKEASEPIGPIAGNQIAALFAFDGGVHAYFGSKANDLTDPKRFGYYFYGSAGVIYMPNGVETQPYILRSPAWMPDERRRWEKIEAPRDAGRWVKAEGRGLANARMVGDLLEAIEHGRDPVCNARDGRWSTEMIVSIYESQRTAGRVSFPLKERRHPLSRL